MTRSLDAPDWRGWRKAGFPDDCWQRDDEQLCAIAGPRRVDLVSRERYRDCRPAFEFALPRAGNSGVFCRVEEHAALSWHSDPEMQLLDAAGHPDGRQPATRNGALYGLLPPALETPIEPGRFIEAAPQICHGAVEHWLDGRCVLRYRLDEPMLVQRIAASKFAASPGFARAPEGHLVLQHHGEAVCFHRLSCGTFD